VAVDFVLPVAGDEVAWGCGVEEFGVSVFEEREDGRPKTMVRQAHHDNARVEYEDFSEVDCGAV
jgi:hypothetical protein